MHHLQQHALLDHLPSHCETVRRPVTGEMLVCVQASQCSKQPIRRHQGAPWRYCCVFAKHLQVVSCPEISCLHRTVTDRAAMQTRLRGRCGHQNILSFFLSEDVRPGRRASCHEQRSGMVCSAGNYQCVCVHVPSQSSQVTVSGYLALGTREDCLRSVDTAA